MTTVHHFHAVVNKMLHDAERKGLVTRNVARLANAPSLTTARSTGPEMRVWSPDELTQFLASIDGNRNEALFRLLAMTGMRRGEVVALRWSDVDIAHRRLTVNQSASVIGGEEIVDTPEDAPQPSGDRPRSRDGVAVEAASSASTRVVLDGRCDGDGERPGVHERAR